MDEQHFNALEHIMAYHEIINNKVIECSFLVGDLFLYENQRIVNALLGKKGKFILNWLGSYIITKVYRSGAYKITNMNGVHFKEPINIKQLQSYYM